MNDEATCTGVHVYVAILWKIEWYQFVSVSTSVVCYAEINGLATNHEYNR